MNISKYIYKRYFEYRWEIISPQYLTHKSVKQTNCLLCAIKDTYYTTITQRWRDTFLSSRNPQPYRKSKVSSKVLKIITNSLINCCHTSELFFPKVSLLTSVNLITVSIFLHLGGIKVKCINNTSINIIFESRLLSS